MINHSHPETEERATAAEREQTKIRPCNAILRARLLAQRDAPGYSNNVIARRLGVSSSVVSQYLNKDGCLYEGDIARLERLVEDFLSNEARRQAMGVETAECEAARQVAQGLEYIRKTSDVGVILAPSGRGKTRGLELYKGGHPTCLLYRTYTWSNDLNTCQAEMFEQVGKKDYDGKTKRVLNTVRNLRGTERLIIVDDAHKLTRPALQWWFDLHDATACPMGLVGTYELLKKLEDDTQRFSRVGLHYEIANEGEDSVDRELVKHLIKGLIPNADGEGAQLLELACQVAAQQGHYRSVHKQIKLAVELRSGSKRIASWVEAFKAAHTMLVRNYNLN